MSQARARCDEQRVLSLAQVRARLEPASTRVLRIPARDRDPFDAALSLTVLPPAARRIVPRQQGKVVIRINDFESRNRTERRVGL